LYVTVVGPSAIYPKNALVVELDGDSDVKLVTANQEDKRIGILKGIGEGEFMLYRIFRPVMFVKS